MKIIELTYGLKGESERYSYIVEDNVKVGQIVRPAFRHINSGRITTTVGIVQKTNKTTSANGQKALNDLADKGINPKSMVTNADLGERAQGVRNEKTGKFEGDASLGGTTKTDRGYVANKPDNYDKNKQLENNRVVSDMNKISYEAQSKQEDRVRENPKQSGYESFADYARRFGAK